MKDPFGLFQQTISISYAVLLLEITAERGIALEQVLKNTGLSEERIRQPQAKMSAAEWSKLVMNALRLTEDEHLGIEYGSRLRPTSHGALGFAFLSCADIETVLNLITAYFCTRIQNFTPSWKADDYYVYVYLDDVHPINVGDEEQSKQLRCFLVECLIFGGIHFLNMLVDSFTSDCEIFLDWIQKTSHRGSSSSTIPIHFNQPRNGFRFPKTYLKRKNPQADNVAFQQALQYCENDKAKVIEGGYRDIQKSIRTELAFNSINGNYPSFQAVAKLLNMSERSLTRHLQSQGTSFMIILTEVRFTEAKRLLLQPQYDIKDIAHMVGYSEATNFIRAFKKEFGETPSQFKKRSDMSS